MEETLPGQPTQTDQRVIPYLMMSCSVIQPGEEEEEGRMFRVMAFFFLTVMCDEPVILETVEHLHPVGSSELIPYFHLRVCTSKIS